MEAPQAQPEPQRSRPQIRGYGVSKNDEAMLEWAEVSEQIAAARNYWIGTTDSDGQPHAVPVWGVWVDDSLFFDGSPHARWVRNLQANPRVVAHLENGEQVVIVEGDVERLELLPVALLPRVAAQSEAKYGGTFEDVGCLVLYPRVAFAWNSFPADATRFVFDRR